MIFKINLALNYAPIENRNDLKFEIASKLNSYEMGNKYEKSG